jgi:hypothetical protein
LDYEYIERLFAFYLVIFFVSLFRVGEYPYQPDSLAPETISGEVVSVAIQANRKVIKDGAGAEVRIVVNESTKLPK